MKQAMYQELRVVNERYKEQPPADSQEINQSTVDQGIECCQQTNKLGL